MFAIGPVTNQPAVAMSALSTPHPGMLPPSSGDLGFETEDLQAMYEMRQRMFDKIEAHSEVMTGWASMSG